MSNFIKTKIILIAVLFLAIPVIASADYLGQTNDFFIDQNYDSQGREKILASLEKVSLKGYFYLESDWLSNLTEGEKKTVSQNLEILGQEFDNAIYPKLTELYGPPWEPGIDNNYTSTILFHKMKEGAGGYFNNGDEYPKLQNSKSNEREMVYLNAEYLSSPIIKSYLAHEFTHLITFNQKEKLKGIQEEIWLNEARADFSSTLLGYDNEYQGSNLAQRVKQFINSPTDSLTEWQNEKKDYGLVNLFTQYLVDHYGIGILVNSLKSQKTGIESINETLKGQGFQKDFSQIFTDWLIALFLNDCNFGESYCYKNENLKNLKITPSLIFLPSTQKTEFSLDYAIKQWTGNWYRIIGGEGDLKLEFDGQDAVNFRVPYVLCKDLETCQVSFLNLDEKQKGGIIFGDFGKSWRSLTLIPSIQSKTSGFSDNEPFFPFSISASVKIVSQEEKKEAELKKQLLAQINDLQKQIEKLKAQIEQLLARQLAEIPAGFQFKKNLSFAVSQPDVIYLKKVLINQNCLLGPTNSRSFDSQTLEGVKCFCQKYKTEISQLAGYQVQCSGLVGRGTRAKLNQILRNFQFPILNFY